MLFDDEVVMPCIPEGLGSEITMKSLNNSLPLLPVSGLEFPWGPKPFREVIAGPLLRNNGQSLESSSLEGSHVGVYFSAHWVSVCPSSVQTEGAVMFHQDQLWLASGGSCFLLCLLHCWQAMSACCYE